MAALLLWYLGAGLFLVFNIADLIVDYAGH